MIAVERVSSDNIWTEDIWTEDIWTEDIWAEDILTEDIWTEDIWTEDIWTEDFGDKMVEQFQHVMNQARRELPATRSPSQRHSEDEYDLW